MNCIMECCCRLIEAHVDVLGIKDEAVEEEEEEEEEYKESSRDTLLVL